MNSERAAGKSISFSRLSDAFKNFSLLSLILLTALANAQEIPPSDVKQETIIEQRIENIAETMEDETLDYTNLLEELSYFREHPLNLNAVTREELRQLHLLDEFQINNLFTHIEKDGKFIAIYELQTIEGFDRQTIQKLLPFIRVSGELDRPRLSFKELMHSGKHNLFACYQQVLEEQAGYADIDDPALATSPNSRYLGNKHRYYTRYRFSYGNYVSVGFTAEKDPGEEFFRGTQKQGFDFYSAHFALRNIGKLKALAVGDFQAQFGQGLTFWSGLAFGKSADALSIKRYVTGLRPYTSVDENLFLRGAGATYEIFKNIEATAFFSRKRIDANIAGAIDTLQRDEEVIFTSFQQTGFHRTPAEMADKDAISEMLYGGNISYKKRSFTAGITAIQTEYGSRLNRNLSYYNQFEFNDNRNTNIGFDYNYIVKNFNFFGEISRSASGGMGYINGAVISVDPRLSLVLLHRNFQKNYHSLNSNPIMESTRPANEKGIYAEISARPFSRIALSAYYDKFSFPWLKYQVNVPSEGYEFLAQLNYTPSKKLDMYGRIRERNKPRNTDIEGIEGIDFVVSAHQVNYRYHVSYAVSPSVRMRSRAEFVNYRLGNGDREKGYLVYQDIIYKSLGSPVSFSFRYALFETGSYNSRIYAYENDVLYAFSIPAYYDRGTRAYLTLRYAPFRFMDLWVRYAQTFYYNREAIGSGLDEIKGNTRSEIKAQVRFRF